MLLLVDAGNTRLKWRLRGAGEPDASGVLLTRESLGLMTAWGGLRARRAVVCSVAGEAVDVVITRVLRNRGIPVDWVRSEVEAHGIRNAYEPPRSLGADRFAAMVAAARRHPGQACLVVNVGTAMTVDALDADGGFLGGCIAPGPDAMQASLARQSPALDMALSWGAPHAGWPRSTRDALTSGIADALCGVLRGMRRRLNAAGIAHRLVVSGGARQVLLGALADDAADAIDEVDELVLEGVTCIARDLGYAV